LEIGKAAIAATLIPRENPDAVVSVGIKDHWYRAVWEAMIYEAPSAAYLGNNRVRFVTFNYDRSLEFFLHEATKHTFGIDDKAAMEQWKKIGILHVYGHLGEFHYEPSDGRRLYNPAASPEAIKIAAAALKVVPEARTDDPFALARAWFGEAERICFLGFGFDSLNMKRLGLRDVIETRPQATPLVVSASTLGKFEAEIAKARIALGCNALPGNWGNWDGSDTENLVTLRKFGLLLP
jgi:hypothetical protein